MNANRLGRCAGFLMMASGLLVAQVRRTPDAVALKHWAAPLYWQPQAAAASLPSSANPLVFVAMTPCRVVDTRASQGFSSPFGAPSLSGGVSRTFPLQSSTTCSIPAAAQAYSLNITVVPAGATGFLTAYPTGQPLPLAATLVWSGGSITSNAAVVPGGTSGSVDVYPNTATDVVIDINGYYGSFGTSGNTALGMGALSSNTTGSNNTAVGLATLGSNTTGQENTAVGHQALFSSATSGGNTAIGGEALNSNQTGNNDTAVGSFAMQFNTTGSENIALGAYALQNNTTGSDNIAIGSLAAVNVAGGSSDNIHIGSQGLATDQGAIRIGGRHTSFFAAGVRGVATGNNNAIPVVIDSNGQLGTINSSRRFKEDIQDMGGSSHALLQLRPVTFRYTKPFDDGSKPIQYGLIAEEVAEVYPDLVAYSADGRIESVKYQVLDSMLLNELQKEHHRIEEQAQRIQLLERRLAALEASPSSAAQ